MRINNMEAEVVRSIFDMYLEGRSIIGIKRELEKHGTLSSTGNTIWRKRSMENILTNESSERACVLF